MNVSEEALFDACALYVLCTAASPLTPEEVIERARNMTPEEQLDALARYQESDPV